MGITRTQLPFDGQFTQVPNTWARDARVSRRARGLLVEILSHRVGWHVSTRSLTRDGMEGRDAVRAMLAELVAAGYLVSVQGRVERGRFGEIEYRLNHPNHHDGKAATDDLDDPHDGAGSTVAGLSGHGAVTVAGSTVAGLSVAGESDHKEDYLSEDHLEEHDEAQPGVAELDDLDGLPKGSRAAQPLPRPFMVTPEMRSWAGERAPSVAVDSVTSDFVAYWREGEGKGKRKKNWTLTWRNWLKREHDRNVERGWKPAEIEDRKVIRGGRVIA